MNLSFKMTFRQTAIPMGMKLQQFNLPSDQTKKQRKKSPPPSSKQQVKKPAIKPNFRNMFATLASAKSGCGSCSGTR
tara:strand:- start:303 stop:533 length:231 start_codon:yes stop_codon:yes gene_type:complete